MELTYIRKETEKGFKKDVKKSISILKSSHRKLKGLFQTC